MVCVLLNYFYDSFKSIKRIGRPQSSIMLVIASSILSFVSSIFGVTVCCIVLTVFFAVAAAAAGAAAAAASVSAGGV